MQYWPPNATSIAVFLTKGSSLAPCLGQCASLTQAPLAPTLTPALDQVTEEGGSDAVIEAPAIYAALDSLGQRVAAWTERQHRAGQPLGADPAEGVLSPEEAAACAERAIKQVRAAFLGVLCTWGPV